MSLCSLCKSISLCQMRGPNLDRMQCHQPSYLALKRSVEAGCRLCGFFWAALEHGIETEQDRNRAALSHVSERYPGRQISLVAWGGPEDSLDRIHVITTGEIPSLSSSSGDEGEDENTIVDPTMHPNHQIALDGVVDLYTYPDDPAAWHGGISGRPLPRTTGDSEEDFQMLSSWLKDCLNNHTMCPKASTEASLPTRIIDVGPADGSIEPYLLQSDKRKGSYITLSHCWGGKVPLTTTKDTLEDRKVSIPFTSLPKTFREAVIITRRFGIRYLWIDSLCIVQDSPTDWEKESAVMGDIYGSGFLNIAARGAVDAEGGCFISREAEPLPCVLKYFSSDCSITGSMYIRSPDFQVERLQDAPLDKRGWVLQERLLPPRVLYFGRQQLYWECAESTLRQDGKYCDVLTDGLRGDLDFKASVDFNAPFPYSSKQPHAYTDPQSEQAEVAARKFLQWYKVVRQYTRRNLTFQSDKLPAISGIGKAFQAKTGCTYIAGLWKEDLIAGIAWYLSQPSDEIISRTLPSWSWARLKGEVNFWSHTRAQVKMMDGSCELINVAYKPAGGLNPYGDIGDAKLEVQGRLIQVHYQPPELPNSTFQCTIFALDGRPVGKVSFDSWASHPDKAIDFFCLLVHGGDYYPAALALELDKGHHEALYKRIGYVRVDSFKGATDGRTPFWHSEPQVVAII